MRRRISEFVLHRLRGTHIQSRLLAAFILLSLVPGLITGVLSYNRSSQAIKEKISTYSSDLLGQIDQNVARELDRLEYDSVDIMFSREAQRALKHHENLGEWEKLDLQWTLHELLVKKFSFLHDVSDVVLFTKDGDKIIAYGSSGSNVLKYEADYMERLYHAADRLDGAPVWFPSNIDQEIHSVRLLVNENDQREGINLVRVVRDITEGAPIGYVLIRTNERFFSKIYQDIDEERHRIFILDENGMIVSSPDPDMVTGNTYQDAELLEQIKVASRDGMKSFNYTVDQKYLVNYTEVGSADWYVIGMIPYAYLNSESLRIGIHAMGVGILCMLVAVLIALVISKSISKPLTNMVNTMEKVKEGDLSVEIQDKEADELSAVARHFDDMLAEVKALLETTKRQEREKREAELLALQAQINPHFLANTLNSIQWMANIQGAENIEKLIGSLIQLLNASIGRDESNILLEEELEYLKDYIVIQEFRYFDKFKVKFDIEPETLHCRIARFLIQPILENAIIHGIQPMQGQGFILVKSFFENGNLKITVTDNGVGFSDGEMREDGIKEPLKRKQGFCGIGMANVQNRIKMIYGDKYGMKIQSVKDVFTTVEVTLPVQE
ncbi:cache domain-containing sensor histidine kinase [Anaerotalea alkaliphila]|uniref:Sensor histidine kinase n=1 Tax=Anaerotalea alkaliphila TaxID=2662126 RepID=A0A7X5HWQ7_9FIRM|nr:sensor histidine kinase [Anaerotalea alkaliphila]NDL68037.1 sensor histidine kinase [Anaerotalea alkaliphila]